MDEILKHGPAVQAELLSYIKAKQRQVGGAGWLADFLSKLEKFAASGKLLRGSLLCYSFEVFAERAADESVIKAAAALEITHSALLIHDDIMDEDDLRRGQPALHRQYQLQAEKDKLANARRLGINMALGAGDATLFFGFEILSSVQADTAVKNALIELFISQLIQTCQGQMQDIHMEAQTSLPSKQAIYDLMSAKTAGYTIVLPLKMGAVLARRPQADMRQLEAVGQAIGTIFQIRDDELGVMGTSAKTGKPVGSDIKQGKKTLFYYFLYNKTSGAERLKLASIFGNAAISASDIKYVQRLATKTGVHGLLSAEVERIKAQAFDAIRELDLADQPKSQIKALAVFCSKRQY